VTHANSTYNHYYSDTIQKRRQDKYKAFMTQARQKATTESVLRGVKSVNIDQNLFQEEITKAVERDMETFAAEEALESQRAIYKACPHIPLSFGISL
jgi:23S rRNA G2069 N7-methylase RlmK/C1962 C5-methylase RlmI